MKEYYYLHNNEQRGPVTLEQLLALNISRDTLVWTEGMVDWKPASQVRDLQPAFQAVPPPPPGGPRPFDQPRSQPFAMPEVDPFGVRESFKVDVEHIPPTVSESQVNTRFRIFSLGHWGSVALTVLGIITLIIMGEGHANDEEMLIAGFLFGTPAFLAMCAAIGFGLSLIHAGWENIQDGNYIKTDPAKAVGLYFIPIFHWYWIFISHRGLVEDMNDYMINRGYSDRPYMNVGLATAACVSRACMAILSYIALIPTLILHYLMMVQIKNGLLHLIRSKNEATGKSSW